MPDPIPPTELIGNEAARDICGGVSRHTLIAWRESKGFPEPVAKIDRTEIWDRRQVRAWYKTYQRLQRERRRRS